jgi:hypothetical protein
MKMHGGAIYFGGGCTLTEALRAAFLARDFRR